MTAPEMVVVLRYFTGPSADGGDAEVSGRIVDGDGSSDSVGE
jgi:hypothetical protein